MDAAFLSLAIQRAARATVITGHHWLVGVAPHPLQHRRRIGRQLQPRIVLRVYHSLRCFSTRRGCGGAAGDHFCTNAHQHLLHGWLVCGDHQQGTPQRAHRTLGSTATQAWLWLFALCSATPVGVLGDLLAAAFNPCHPPYTKGLTRRCSQPLHRVRLYFLTINTHSFQSSLALISGGRSCSR
jgi:hypothetical protein